MRVAWISVWGVRTKGLLIVRLVDMILTHTVMMQRMILVRLMRKKPSRAQGTENSNTEGQKTAVTVEGCNVLKYIHSKHKINNIG